MKKILFYPLLVLVLSTGCTGPYYYDLHLEPQKTEEAGRIEKVLKVDDISSGEPYLNQGIVYRNDPYRVEYSTFSQWAKRPGDVIREAVIRFYRGSGIFKRVTEEYSSTDPELILRIIIYSIEIVREDEKWYARLALDLEIVDQRQEQVITTHSFDRKEKIKGKKAKYLPPQISRILREELILLTDKLRSRK
jgi:ABC-type uncharacterized transport system auxiliary subunit